MSIPIRVKDASGATMAMIVYSNTTIGSLRKEIADMFKIEYAFDILWGYPPTVCCLTDDALIGANVASNDILRIRKVVEENPIPVSVAKSSQSSAKVRKATPKKAPGSGIKASSSVTSGRGNSLTFGGRIATLAGSGPARGKVRSVGQMSTSLAKRRPRASANSKKKERTGDGTEDICSALMSAADGGSGGRSKALRSVFRNAVAHQYNDSTAIARLRAVFAGRYAFQPSLESRILNSGVSTKMTVTFPLKPGSLNSATHTEVVDMLSVELMRAVLLAALEDDGEEGGMAREFLKPVNMSKASPRIFWSLVKEFGSDIPGALGQLFPQVLDWAWLSDRKRQLSERALVNLQQQQDAAEAASSRKRARVAKKKITGAEAAVEDPIPSPKGARDSASVLCTGADDVTAVCTMNHTGLRDSSMITAMKERMSIDSMVPENLLPSLIEYMGENSALLLASLNFEEPEVIAKINSIYATSLSSTPSSSSSSSSSSVKARPVISEDSIESWVACAQSSMICMISQVLFGGSRRLLMALRSLGQRCPSKLRVWRLVPHVLYSRLLEMDPGLETLCLSRVRNSDGVLGEYFSEDWVKWMCGVSEDMRSDPSVLWIDHFSYLEEDEEAEDDVEEEVKEEDDAEDWVFVSADGNSVGTRVRCYPLSDDYWDDGVVIGYLPPTDTEPTALWRVQGERGGMLNRVQGGDNSEEGEGKKKNVWSMDLDEGELLSAIALHIAIGT